jgi:hypothetical protein
MCSLLAEASALENAAWQCLAQVVALGVVGFFVNILYQRYRQRATARQELIDDVDTFTARLYKPRKIYQAVLDTAPDLLAGIDDGAQRECRRVEMLQRCLEEFVEVTGRFRAIQVKLVPLYGFHVELFGYYLAIWRYLKEVRRRMEQRQSLYFHHEQAESADAFYRLIDRFRFRLLVEKISGRSVGPVQPPADLLKQMQQRGDAVYTEFFEQPSKPGTS